MRTLTFDYRERIQNLLHRLKESLVLITELKSAIIAKHTSFDSECGKIAKRGTAVQAIKFLLWIKKNEEMLSKVNVFYKKSFRGTGLICRAIGVSGVHYPS